MSALPRLLRPPGTENSLAHAHAENRDLAAVVLDGRIANARILLRVSWTWADYQLCRVFRDEIFEGNFVISVHGHFGAFEDEVLVDIPSERVVIVNEYDIGSGGYRRRWCGVAGRVVDEF